MAENQLPSTVHNHFRNVKLFKEQELGRGSFATVCRAQCDDLPCAAKVLHAGFFDQEDPDPGEQTFITKFVEECKILPSITHPNIVQCFGTYQDPMTDLPVLLMELMDESLTDYIEGSRDPLPFYLEVSFSYDVALGLSYLHCRGYVHRDLSSNNVLIIAGVRAKITDFGMCRAMTGPSYRQTRLTLCPGTHPFMPPEALVDPPTYTDKLDIFSLGVVMIQIMSHQYPKPGPAHRQLRTMLLQAIPEEERRSNHIKLIHQSHQMLPLVKQCIQNSHHKRPSSHDVCNGLRSLKEAHDYQQSKDQESVQRKLQKASQLHEVHCQKLQARHQEEIAEITLEHSRNIQGQIATIEAAYVQEIEGIHRHYNQQLIQLDGRIKQLSIHTPEPVIGMPQMQHDEVPPLPPRGYVPQRQQSAQLPLPPMQGQQLLQYLQDDQNPLPNGRRSSAPEVQPSQSDRWVQPPPSPLLRQTGQPVAQHMPILHSNSKDNYSNLDKAMNKSKGKGTGIHSNANDDDQKDATPFEPSNLPEPVYDTYDLEMFHQKASNPEDFDAGGHISMFINPRSTNFDDFSGPDLDYHDHMAYLSHDSGHIGLSAGGSTLQSEHDATWSLFGLITAPRAGFQYKDVQLPQKYSPSSSVSFQICQDTSTDSQPPSIDTQQPKPPVPRPSGGLRELNEDSLPSIPSSDSECPPISRPKPPVLQPSGGLRELNEDSLPSIPSSDSEHPPISRPKPPVLQPSGGLRELNEDSLPSIPSSDSERPPVPRPRSHQNLQYVPSMKVSQVFESPPSPSRSKPAIKPRKGSPCNDRSNESSTTLSKTETTNKDISLEGTCISQPLPSIHECLTTEDGAPTSHITSMESSSSDNLQFETQTSLESGSPHPSLESKPSMSNKSDPCSSTPSEEAPSACSGDKVFQESAVDSSLDSWVDVSLVEKDSEDAFPSLDSLLRPRERAGAFAAATSYKTANPAPMVMVIDIENARPCWFCTNLTTLDICDVCGNPQKRGTTV